MLAYGGGVDDRPSRFGALLERDYRMLFSATLVTSLGDSVANIALAFAVLAVGSATDFGIVLAVRQGVSAAVLVFGGVLSDRLPRNLIMVGASLVQGASQAALAAAVLTGRATLGVFVVLAVSFGLGDGLVLPAEVGLVPQVISPARLPQANALQGLSRSGVRVVGPALGGLLVVAASPGWALALDSLSFVAAAAFLARIRLPARVESGRERFFQELREGWREFRSRTWLWSTVVIFGIGNIFFMFWSVLGPDVARMRLGGAGAWAVIVSAGGAGAVAGGLVALRYRPRRPLLACVLWPLGYVPQLLVLASGAPTAAVAAASFVAGASISIHMALWFTVFQREIPERAQSRVSSYDALGSFVLVPLGAAIAGPVAAAVGTSTALWIAAVAIVLTNTSMLILPSVWTLGRDWAGSRPPSTVGAQP
jgi:MFS family permease